MDNVFITGGTTGIGLELAKAYIADGYRVGICGRDLSRLTDTVKDHQNLNTYQADVTNREELHQCIREFADGKLNILFANAGVAIGDKTKIPDFELARTTININVIGFLNTFEVGMDLMKDSGGQLVGMASVAGYVGLPGSGSYCASKSAVQRLCETFQVDLKPLGITTTLVNPGFIDTPLTKKNDHPMPFIISAEKAAGMIKKAVARKQSIFTFPIRMKLMMMFLEKMPRRLYLKLMSYGPLNYSKD
jgi:short-subunit dehydrogenase